MQQPSTSIAQSGVSRADLLYRNFASFAVLSKYRFAVLLDLLFIERYRTLLIY